MPQDPRKIREAIDKMVSQGASDEEIDLVVQSLQQGDADFSDVSSGASSERKSRARDIVAPLAQGATFGWADEALGAVEGLDTKLRGGSFSEGYERGKQKVRSTTENFRRENPKTALAAEIAGGVGPSLAAAPAGLARAGAGLLRRAAAGAAEGAAAGGIYGAGAGEGSERLSGAAMGAAAGATIGGAVLPVASGVPALARNIVAPFSKSMAPKQANRLLAKAIERDALHPVELAGRAVPGKPQILPDVGGENVLGLARGAQAIPSTSKESLSKTLLERQQGEMSRAGQDLERAFGVPQDNVFAIADDLVKSQKAKAKPLYDTAHPIEIRNPKVTKEVAGLMQIPVFRRAMQRGQELARVQKIPVGKGQRLTVRDIDYWKQGLDNLIESSRGSENAVARQEARAYRERLDEVLKMVDNEVPEYAIARRTFAGDARLREALEEGRNFVAQDPREIAATVKGMSESERELYNRGAIDSLNQMMSKVDDEGTASAVKKIFGNPYKREQLKALVGDQAYETLAERLGVERTMNRTARTVLSGSPTARIGAEISDIMGMNPGEIGAMAGDVARGNILGAVLRRGINAVGKRATGNVGNVASDLSGKMLLRPGTPEFDQLMALVEAINRQSRKGRVAGTATRRIAGGQAGGSLSP